MLLFIAPINTNKYLPRYTVYKGLVFVWLELNELWIPWALS